MAQPPTARPQLAGPSRRMEFLLLPAAAVSLCRAFVKRHPRLKRVLLILLAPVLRRLRFPPAGIRPVLYRRWIAAHDSLTAADREAIRADVARLRTPPRFSLVLPLRGGGDAGGTIASVRAQLYAEWELLCLGSGGRRPEAAPDEARIRWLDDAEERPAADGINAALAQATGDWVMLLGAGDLLAEQALYEFARAIEAHPDAQVIYADEDRLDAAGQRVDPWFKPGFDPDLLLGWNYIGRPVALRRDLLLRLGGLRAAFADPDAAEHDLMLRATEAAGEAGVHRIPSVLRHRRTTNPSAEAVEESRRAVREHLAARGIVARVEAAPLAPDRHRVHWPEPRTWPLVTAIVPTRDGAAMLERCLDGVLHRTDYAALEVLIVDNGSERAETHALFDRLRADPRVRILPAPGPFNFSALNNQAVREARGEILLLLNNDIDVIGPGWLREMVTHAVRPEIGAVGAKLLYANGRLQHGGTVLGVGVADHLLTGSRRDDPGPRGMLAVVRCASAVTAACLALRRADYEAVGGMDEENLAVAFNDVDLCLRLRERGLRILWTPFAELYHLESASRGFDLSGPKAERFRREQAYMHARWGPLLRADPYWNPNLSLGDTGRDLAWPPRRERPWRQAPR